MIDFEEYIFNVMAIANAIDELDMVRVAFEVVNNSFYDQKIICN